MLHFAKFAAVFFLALVFVTPAAHAADQCVGENDQGDAQCTAITAGTICCAVQGQDNSCQTLAACITLQANAAPGTTQTPEPQVSPTAQTPSNSNSAGQGQVLVNPLRAGSIPELLAIVLQGLVQIGSIILVLMLVWVGFKFVVAQGNEEEIRSARDALMWTVIGGLVLLGAQAIATLIQATVNAL